MKLTDQRGEVTATYVYGTYGELLRGDTTLTRFLNQDVVRGSLTASQSLNRYSYVQGNPVSYTDPFGLSPLNGLFTGTNFWHAVLGFIGCVPGPVGMVANLADAAVYALIDRDYGMAALAMLDCVSGGLSTLAKAASAAGKATKSARYLKTAGSLISNVSSFAQNASAGMATAFDMYEKYMIKGEKFDSSTPWEVASLGLSIVGMGISGRGMAGDTKALSKMLNEDMISSRMSKALSRQMGGRQTGTPLEYNLQFFGGGGKDAKTYYHVTTAENAKSIIASGELRNGKWESYVFAWNQQPTKKQASIAGISSEATTVIKFKTNASFQYDDGNTGKLIEHMVVRTTDAQRVPISIWDMEIVGFKKGWWQFWKK